MKATRGVMERSHLHTRTRIPDQTTTEKETTMKLKDVITFVARVLAEANLDLKPDSQRLSTHKADASGL